MTRDTALGMDPPGRRNLKQPLPEFPDLPERCKPLSHDQDVVAPYARPKGSRCLPLKHLAPYRPLTAQLSRTIHRQSGPEGVFDDLNPSVFINQSRIETHLGQHTGRAPVAVFASSNADPIHLPAADPFGSKSKSDRLFDLDKDNGGVPPEHQIDFTGLTTPAPGQNLISAIHVMRCNLIFRQNA